MKVRVYFVEDTDGINRVDPCVVDIPSYVKEECYCEYIDKVKNFSRKASKWEYELDSCLIPNNISKKNK